MLHHVNHGAAFRLQNSLSYATKGRRAVLKVAIATLVLRNMEGRHTTSHQPKWHMSTWAPYRSSPQKAGPRLGFGLAGSAVASWAQRPASMRVTSNSPGCFRSGRVAGRTGPLVRGLEGPAGPGRRPRVPRRVRRGGRGGGEGGAYVGPAGRESPCGTGLRSFGVLSSGRCRENMGGGGVSRRSSAAFARARAAAAATAGSASSGGQSEEPRAATGWRRSPRRAASPPLQECRPARRSSGPSLVDDGPEEPLMLLLAEEDVVEGAVPALAQLSQPRTSITAGRSSSRRGSRMAPQSGSLSLGPTARSTPPPAGSARGSCPTGAGACWGRERARRPPRRIGGGGAWRVGGGPWRSRCCTGCGSGAGRGARACVGCRRRCTPPPEGGPHLGGFSPSPFPSCWRP